MLYYIYYTIKKHLSISLNKKYSLLSQLLTNNIIKIITSNFSPFYSALFHSILPYILRNLIKADRTVNMEL